MSEENNERETKGTHEPSVSVRVPMTLSIRDIVVIITAIVSIVISWGVVSTRLSLLEQRVVDIYKEQVTRRETLDTLKEKDAAHDQKILELQLRLENLKKERK